MPGHLPCAVATGPMSETAPPRTETEAIPAYSPVADTVTSAESPPPAVRQRRTGSTLAWRTARAVAGSGTLRAAFIYGGAGVGFTIANLLLARSLEPREYGLVALVVALYNLAIPAASLGADGIVLRRHLPLDTRLLARVALTSIAVGGAAFVGGVLLYDLTLALGLVVFGGVVAGGIGATASAHFQSTQRRGLALLLSQGVNFVMLALAGIVILADLHDARLPLAGMMLYYVLVTAVLWTIGLREDRRADAPDADAPFPTREALSYVGVVGVSIGLVQVERLVLPSLLDLEALALFGVLAAVVGSAFRVLLLAVDFTLVPELRRAPSAAARRHVLRREAIAVGAVLLVATVGLWLLTPAVVRFFVGDKYPLAPPLVFATIAAGWFKVLSTFGRASVTALASNRDLSRFNVAGWLAVGVSLLGAVVGQRWGLTGIVWGTSAGWVALTLAAIGFAAPHFRRAPGATGAAPDGHPSSGTGRPPAASA